MFRIGLKTKSLRLASAVPCCSKAFHQTEKYVFTPLCSSSYERIGLTVQPSAFHDGHWNRSRSRWRTFSAVGSLLGLGIGAGFFLFGWSNFSLKVHIVESASILPSLRCAQKTNTDDAEQSTRSDGKQSLRKTFNFVADVAEKVSPAVVNIAIEDESLRNFNMFDGDSSSLRISGGSGFIVREDGLIMTNAHLFMGHSGNVVQVKLFDGRTLQGRLVTIDTVLDLAILKIDGMTNLPVLKFCQDTARVGEFVLAIGSPLTLKNCVSMGVVSNPEQTLNEIGFNRPISYIQTDAAINQGNSGGPLVNLDGEVIGINAMKIAGTDGIGISFAVPAKHAAKFLKEATQEESTGGWKESLFGRKKSNEPSVKRPRRPHFGVSYFVIEPHVLKALRRNNPVFNEITYGAVVQSVTIGSPAHRCGIEPGDVILSIDGENITDGKQLQKAIASEKDKKLLKIFRRGVYFDLVIDYELDD